MKAIFIKNGAFHSAGKVSMVLSIALLGAILAGCGQSLPAIDPNFTMDLFTESAFSNALGHHDWSSRDITNITLVKVRYGTGFRRDADILSKPVKKSALTDAISINSAIACFQSSPPKGGYSPRRTQHEWQVFAFNISNEVARAILMETDQTNVLAAVINTAGTTVYIYKSISLP